jgi:stress-induced morphogen
MPIAVRGKGDSFTDQVVDALESYESQHPGAEIEAYRRNSVSIRVRIVDPDFSGISRAERHEIVWRFLEKLPEEVQSQVSLLLLLTPEETKSSIANSEFENPIPSSL